MLNWHLLLYHFLIIVGLGKSLECDKRLVGNDINSCTIPEYVVKPNETIVVDLVEYSLEIPLVNQSNNKIIAGEILSLLVRGFVVGPNAAQIPSTRLSLTKGITFDLLLRNRLNLISKYQKSFFNEKIYGMNIHFHGLHISAKQENITELIKPGQQKTYHIDIQADHAAGLHWYHMHIGGTNEYFISGGLFGTLQIQDDVLGREIPLDLLELETFTLVIHKFYPAKIVALSKGFTREYDNVYGNFPRQNLRDELFDISYNVDLEKHAKIEDADTFYVLVNGFLEPTLTLNTDKWSRIQILYVGGEQVNQGISDAYIAITQAENCDVILLGKDGVYLRQSRPIHFDNLDKLWLHAGSRAEILFRCTTDSDRQLTLEVPHFFDSMPVPRVKNILKLSFHNDFINKDSAALKAQSLSIIKSCLPSYLPDLTLPEVRPRHIAPYSSTVKNKKYFKSATRQLTLDRFYNYRQRSLGVEVFPFEINGEAVFSLMDSKRPKNLSVFELNNVYEVELLHGGHPLHFHINHVQLLENFNDPSNYHLRGDYVDTIATACDSKVGCIINEDRPEIEKKRIRFFASDHTGLFLWHCHNLDHADSGSMAENFIIDSGIHSPTEADCSVPLTLTDNKLIDPLTDITLNSAFEYQLITTNNDSYIWKVDDKILCKGKECQITGLTLDIISRIDLFNNKESMHLESLYVRNVSFDPRISIKILSGSELKEHNQIIVRTEIKSISEGIVLYYLESEDSDFAICIKSINYFVLSKQQFINATIFLPYYRYVISEKIFIHAKIYSHGYLVAQSQKEKLSAHVYINRTINLSEASILKSWLNAYNLDDNIYSVSNSVDLEINLHSTNETRIKIYELTKSLLCHEFPKSILHLRWIEESLLYLMTQQKSRRSGIILKQIEVDVRQLLICQSNWETEGNRLAAINLVLKSFPTPYYHEYVTYFPLDQKDLKPVNFASLIITPSSVAKERAYLLLMQPNEKAITLTVDKIVPKINVILLHSKLYESVITTPVVLSVSLNITGKFICYIKDFDQDTSPSKILVSEGNRFDLDLLALERAQLLSCSEDASHEHIPENYPPNNETKTESPLTEEEKTLNTTKLIEANEVRYVPIIILNIVLTIFMIFQNEKDNDATVATCNEALLKFKTTLGFLGIKTIRSKSAFASNDIISSNVVLGIFMFDLVYRRNQSLLIFSFVIFVSFWLSVYTINDDLFSLKFGLKSLFLLPSSGFLYSLNILLKIFYLRQNKIIFHFYKYLVAQNKKMTGLSRKHKKYLRKLCNQNFNADIVIEFYSAKNLIYVITNINLSIILIFMNFYSMRYIVLIFYIIVHICCITFFQFIQKLYLG